MPQYKLKIFADGICRYEEEIPTTMKLSIAVAKEIQIFVRSDFATIDEFKVEIKKI